MLASKVFCVKTMLQLGVDNGEGWCVLEETTDAQMTFLKLQKTADDGIKDQNNSHLTLVSSS